MRVCEIEFSDPEIPFEAASILLSFIAYPTQADERSRFSRDLCRLEHRAATLRNPEWRSSPKLVRPDIFFDAISKESLQAEVNNLVLRIVTCVSMLLPHLHGIDRPDLPIFGEKPTVTNIAWEISKAAGKSKKSGSDIISEVWAPAKPVAHLAYAYWACVFQERWKDDHELATKNPISINSADKQQLLKVLYYAELIRRELLEPPASRFKEDDLIKFTACGLRD
jgi:hypothetical protein